jgi:hypothetical protein
MRTEANETIPFPSDVASRYRPNSPIAAVYGSFESVSPSSGSNNTMFLFFPLPTSLNSLSPNPSLHTLSAEPYWNSNVPVGRSSVANKFSINWTDPYFEDTGVVPYASGPSALFGDEGTDAGPDLSVDNNIVQTMPRAWTPLLLDGSDDSPAARVVVVYQDDKGAIQLSDVIGGKSGIYPVITGVK